MQQCSVLHSSECERVFGASVCVQRLLTANIFRGGRQCLGLPIYVATESLQEQLLMNPGSLYASRVSCVVDAHCRDNALTHSHAEAGHDQLCMLVDCACNIKERAGQAKQGIAVTCQQETELQMSHTIDVWRIGSGTYTIKVFLCRRVY